MYSETTGVIHALKCVINVTVNNRDKCEFNSFHGGESNPNCPTISWPLNHESLLGNRII